MHIIKVDAIKSTNSFVREFYEKNTDFQPICVSATHQTSGRGQRGAVWSSEAGKNLTFSILYPTSSFRISQVFMMNALVSLSILNVLQEEQIPNLRLKWPNDIMAEKKKIGGILIENILQKDKVAATVIGIGLNVNQLNLEGIPNATSLNAVTGKNFDLDSLLEKITEKIDQSLQNWSDLSSEELISAYENVLFRKDVISVFEIPQKATRLNGIIRGVTREGKLKVEMENENIQQFDLKEIKLLY